MQEAAQPKRSPAAVRQQEAMQPIRLPPMKCLAASLKDQLPALAADLELARPVLLQRFEEAALVKALDQPLFAALVQAPAVLPLVLEEEAKVAVLPPC